MSTTLGLTCLTLVAAAMGAASGAERASGNRDGKTQAVIDEVEKACLEGPVYMIGRKRAERLAELVRKAKPRLVVECGTALGYSGLWIARELKAAGRGKLITIEIDPKRAEQARASFRKAGLEKFITVWVGDARQVVKNISGPIDFVFIDCGYANYYPCLKGLQNGLRGGATIVADNVGVGAAAMGDYLDEVRSKYESRTEWFDVNLPWGKRDAMEISVLPKGTTFRVPFERPLSKIAGSLKESIPPELSMLLPLRVSASKGRTHYRMHIVFTFQGSEDPSLRLRIECRVLDRRGKVLAQGFEVSRDPRIVAREGPRRIITFPVRRAPIFDLGVDIPKDAIDEHKIEHLEFVIAKETTR